MEPAKAGHLLEKKIFCLERLKKVFYEQGICLDNAQIQLFVAKSQIVDRIINEIKAIDAQLSQLGVDPLGKGDSGDSESLGKAISRLAQENILALSNSENRLIKMRDDVRDELNGVVSKGQISAYKPFASRRPIYFDRVN
jgi:hypothetical protein